MRGAAASRLSAALLLLGAVGVADARPVRGAPPPDGAGPSTAGAPHLELVLDDPAGVTVAVRGCPPPALEALSRARLDAAQWRSLLAVRTAEAAGAGGPAMLGTYAVTGGAIVFTPRFPFLPGLAYEARFDGVALARLAGGRAAAAVAPLRFTLPEPAGPPPRVVAVYPSADVVPENLLRLYVHFSAPMRARGVAAQVRLHEAGGSQVELPFVEIPDGLWDPRGLRLTLFLHPGRVKRGVGPNRALGPPLRAGGEYRLEIGSGLRDAAGRPLAEPFEKRFRAAAPDRSSPDPRRWRLVAPAGPRGSLAVDLPEPLDRALLERLVAVRDAAGAEVPGAVTVAAGETRWEFTPRQPWRPGSYELVVESALEDLAGNSVGRLFDEAVAAASDQVAEPGSGGAVALGFVVPAPH